MFVSLWETSTEKIYYLYCWQYIITVKCKLTVTHAAQYLPTFPAWHSYFHCYFSAVLRQWQMCIEIAKSNLLAQFPFPHAILKYQLQYVSYFPFLYPFPIYFFKLCHILFHHIHYSFICNVYLFCECKLSFHSICVWRVKRKYIQTL